MTGTTTTFAGGVFFLVAHETTTDRVLEVVVGYLVGSAPASRLLAPHARRLAVLCRIRGIRLARVALSVAKGALPILGAHMAIVVVAMASLWRQPPVLVPFRTAVSHSLVWSGLFDGRLGVFAGLAAVAGAAFPPWRSRRRSPRGVAATFLGATLAIRPIAALVFVLGWQAVAGTTRRRSLAASIATVAASLTLIASDHLRGPLPALRWAPWWLWQQDIFAVVGAAIVLARSHRAVGGRPMAPPTRRPTSQGGQTSGPYLAGR